MSYPRLFAILVASLSFALCASGQTFNPSDYGNVTLHLKADSLGLANNAPVAAWGSLTAVAGSQPLYIASDARFGNKPVVKFDGSNDVMTWASANLNARTIFAAVSYTHLTLPTIYSV